MFDRQGILNIFTAIALVLLSTGVILVISTSLTSLTSCATVPTITASTNKSIADMVTLAIVGADIIKPDLNLRTDASFVLGVVSEHLHRAKNKEIPVRVVVKHISNILTSEGVHIIDRRVLLIVELAFDRYLPGYLDIITGTSEYDLLVKIVDRVKVNLNTGTRLEIPGKKKRSWDTVDYPMVRNTEKRP